jgi:hypothetical protein
MSLRSRARSTGTILLIALVAALLVSPVVVAQGSPVDFGSWFALGSNGSGNGALDYPVHALAVSGNDLYAGGTFENAGGIPEADNVARWDGSSWFALGSNGSGDGLFGIGDTDAGPLALAVSGGDLYVGGDFMNVAGIPEADYIARWDGSTWSALGSDGSGQGALSFPVFALAVSGDDLYVGGHFTNAAGIAAADHVARWDGSAWSAVGPTDTGEITNEAELMNAYYTDVLALAVSGSNLYVGGNFEDFAGIPEADNLALWDGSAWSAVGSDGSGGGVIDGRVLALAASGGNLYVGGSFDDAAGIPEADGVVKWDGSTWSALGSNGSGDGPLAPYGSVNALTISGSDLYVGGNFSDAAGIPEADNVARWDGSAWSALGSNGGYGGGGPDDAYYNGALNLEVMAFAVSGSDLYVGGQFYDAAFIPEADKVATWSAGVGVPLPTATPAPPEVLACQRLAGLLPSEFDGRPLQWYVSVGADFVSGSEQNQQLAETLGAPAEAFCSLGWVYDQELGYVTDGGMLRVTGVDASTSLPAFVDLLVAQAADSGMTLERTETTVAGKPVVRLQVSGDDTFAALLYGFGEIVAFGQEGPAFEAALAALPAPGEPLPDVTAPPQ